MALWRVLGGALTRPGPRFGEFWPALWRVLAGLGNVCGPLADRGGARRVRAGPPLAFRKSVTAFATRQHPQALFRGREFAAAAEACSRALARDPFDIELRVLLAQSLIALRRDGDARRELRRGLKTAPRCSAAYRLLGELALERAELESARMFFREVLRLDAGDAEATRLLGVVETLSAPAAVDSDPPPFAAEPPRATPAAEPPRRDAESSPGFGDYLVQVGMLTAAELREVLAYHSYTGVRVGGAAVALKYASGPKVEWAALAYHSRQALPG